MFKVISITTGQLRFEAPTAREARRWMRRYWDQWQRLYDPQMNLLRG